jgi:hypothetical protein
MGHGTHVCGQLVATHDMTNGFEGLVGNCARVSMHCGLSEPYDPVPYYQGLLAACTARLINLSVGGEQEDQLESNIIRDALARDAVVVAASCSYLSRAECSGDGQPTGRSHVGYLDGDAYRNRSNCARTNL